MAAIVAVAADEGIITKTQMFRQQVAFQRKIESARERERKRKSFSPRNGSQFRTAQDLQHGNTGRGNASKMRWKSLCLFACGTRFSTVGFARTAQETEVVAKRATSGGKPHKNKHKEKKPVNTNQKKNS